MAGENTNFKLEIAAGMVKDYSGRWATNDQDIILDDVIEILRRCHTMPRTFDLDDLAEAIADYCIAAYGPPLYEFNETNERSATVQAGMTREPRGAQEPTVDDNPSDTPSDTPSGRASDTPSPTPEPDRSFTGPMKLGADLPPELDLPTTD